jgi:phospholipid transport system substrate-binding protein
MRGISLIAVALVMMTAKATDTATPLPNQIVQETSEKILEIIDKDAQKLQNDPKEVQRLVDEILLPVIDLNAFSKLVLAHNWRKASPEQRQRFIREFKGMLIRTYTKYLVDYSGTKVMLVPKKGSQQDPKRQFVFTEVIMPGKLPLAIDYSFWFSGGKWKAYNVTVDGLSLVHLFRTDYTREINETSLDALIERLSKANLDTKGKTDEHERSAQ